MKNKISIILPLYNASRFIGEAIVSVQAQTHTDWELLVVDDVSTDNSAAIVQKYAAKDKRIKLLQHSKNAGAAQARNTGIKNATGRYIAFIDADDVWLPNKLEKQLQFMHTNKLAFTYSSQLLIDANGKEKGRFITKPVIDYRSMLKTCWVGCCTAMYDTEIVGKQYFETQRGQEDYILWLQIMKQIGTTKGIIEPLAKYRAVSGAVSANKIAAAKRQWKVYRELEKLNLMQSSYYFIHYAVNAVFRFGLKRWLP